MGSSLQLDLIRKGVSLSQKISPDLAGKIAGQLFLTPQRYKQPEWESELLKTAEETRIIAGVRVWLWGDGPNVILAHGWSGRGAQMGRFVEPLVKAGFRAILFDGPAHGPAHRSTLRTGLSLKRRTNIFEFSEVILQIEKQYGSTYAIIGHSFGGAASALAIHRGLKAQKLIMIATPSDLLKVFDSFSGFLNLSRESKSAFQKYVELDAKHAAQDLSPLEIAKDIYAPTLLIHDPLDREVPFSHAERALKAWPNAEICAIEKAGHYRILKNDQAIQMAIAFLKK